MVERTYLRLFWVLALVGAALDQISKYAVFRWLYNGGFGDERRIIPNIFEIVAQFAFDRETGEMVRVTGDGPVATLRTLAGGDVMPQVNHGALFGFLSQHVGLANTLFAVISLIAAVGITIWVLRSSACKDGFLSASLGLILAGTLGNLYDRLVFNGVRDFLHFHYYQSFDWPVFNIADCCLVCGAFLLLSQAFFRRPEQDKEATEPAKGTEKVAADVL